MVATTKHNLGLLELARAKYHDALHMLGEARREFDALKMPQMLAVAEQGLADVYLELNLLPEALSHYENAIQLFSRSPKQSHAAPPQWFPVCAPQ